MQATQKKATKMHEIVLVLSEDELQQIREHLDRNDHGNIADELVDHIWQSAQP